MGVETSDLQWPHLKTRLKPNHSHRSHNQLHKKQLKWNFPNGQFLLSSSLFSIFSEDLRKHFCSSHVCFSSKACAKEPLTTLVCFKVSIFAYTSFLRRHQNLGGKFMDDTKNSGGDRAWAAFYSLRKLNGLDLSDIYCKITASSTHRKTH